MELTVNFKPAAQLMQTAVGSLNNKVLDLSKAVADGAEKANNFLFADDGKTEFTLSVFGGLAVSSYNPGALVTTLGSTIFTSLVIANKDGIVSDQEIHEEALEVLVENHPDFEGETSELVDAHLKELGEIKAGLNQAYNADTGANLRNLAITNAVATFVSQAVFGNNTLGLVSLAATTAVRLMQD